ncbi:MAG TPA: hypothetical protein VK432_07085 [Stellaceae bacterium]|nr:hypothetical protein [Stellaceae bacterium]
MKSAAWSPSLLSALQVPSYSRIEATFGRKPDKNSNAKRRNETELLFHPIQLDLAAGGARWRL